MLKAWVCRAAMGILFAVPLSVKAAELEIGLVLCLTSECAVDGDSTLKGAQLAAEELNAEGGVLGRQIMLRVENSHEAVSGMGAVTAFKKLRLNPEIKFFMGPTWTPGGLALAPLAAKQPDIIIASPSLGVREFSAAGENIFNTHGAEEVSTRTLARLALENGWKRIAVWSSQQPWESAQGNFFEDEIKKGGGEVAVKLEPLPTISQLNAEALKIITSKPDAVFFSVINQQAIAARALAVLGYRGPKIAAYVDEPRLKEAQGALEGTIFGRMALPSPEFAAKFKRRYPAEDYVEPPAGVAYDTLKMYAKAVREAGTFEPGKVRAALLRMRFAGVSGEIRFDSQGCAIRKPQLKQIRDGKEVDYH